MNDLVTSLGSGSRLDDFFDGISDEQTFRLEYAENDPEADVLIDLLDTEVIGQDEAKRALAYAFLGAVNSFMPREGTLGNFIFFGDSSVGKSLMAEKLGEILTGQKGGTTRIPCGDIATTHDMTNYFQAPSGLVGARDSTPLTDDELFQAYNKGKEEGTLHPLIAKLNKPFAVLLFDELDKSIHPLKKKILNITDDGVIKFAVGKEKVRGLPYSQVTDLGGVFVIMTSNIGVTEASKNGIGFVQRGEIERKAKFMDALKEYFSDMPEFLNRIDEEIVFEKLGRTGCRRILSEVFFPKYIDAFRSLWGGYVDLQIDKQIIEMIFEKGYSESKQGRGMKNAFRKHFKAETDKMLNKNFDIFWKAVEREHPIQLQVTLNEKGKYCYVVSHIKDHSHLEEYMDTGKRQIEDILSKETLLSLGECRSLHTSYISLLMLGKELGIAFSEEKKSIEEKLLENNYSKNDIKRLEMGCDWKGVKEFDFMINGDFGDIDEYLKKEISILETEAIDFFIDKVLDSEYTSDKEKEFIIKEGVSLVEFMEKVLESVVGAKLTAEELAVFLRKLSMRIVEKRTQV